MLINLRNALMAGKRLPYDAEVEYLAFERALKSVYYIDLPGGDFPGLGCHILCMTLDTHHNNNLSPLGWPKGCTYTDYMYCSLYSNTGFHQDAPKDTTIEWYAHDDGMRQKSWLKANGVVGSNPAPIDRERIDIAPVDYFRLIGAENNQYYVRQGRVYFIRIYNFDDLIYDFIPVRFTNELGQSEGAMYDRANPTVGMNPDGSARTDGLYRNQGTGAFGYGNDLKYPIPA